MPNKNTPQIHSTSRAHATVERPRAAGYVRVAAINQAHSQSNLRTQRAQVRAKAKEEGLHLVRIIEDAGVSAHDLQRPGLARLFTLINNGNIKAVIVPDIARLARDPNHLEDLVARFSDSGARLIILDDVL
jgi:DNA invertase Pin-like site-specific DNA recombinase